MSGGSYIPKNEVHGNLPGPAPWLRGIYRKPDFTGYWMIRVRRAEPSD
jgi:hypothetical protein